MVEISTDGGATWMDIGTGAYNGSTNGATSAPIGTSHPAFVNRIRQAWPNFVPVALNLGTAYANQDVRIRFRIGADESTGAPGWDIDDIAFTGLTNTPFAALVAKPASATPNVIRRGSAQAEPLTQPPPTGATSLEALSNGRSSCVDGRERSLLIRNPALVRRHLSRCPRPN